MPSLDPFTLRDPIEDVAARLGELYANVSLSRDPMFSWVQVANDVTILGEDLRRDRGVEGINRAGKVLIRLLEFVGYYTYVHPLGAGGFGDFVAETLRAPSHADLLGQSLPEGPTRWIVYKYPFACSKCGQLPCHCMIEPWILENRREDPERYLERFKNIAEGARARLKHRKVRQLSLLSLVSHFRRIYRNSYYAQDPWKIGMHLSEELGEATTELSRMDLQFRAQQHFNVRGELPEIVRIAKKKLESEIKRVRGTSARRKRAAELEGELLKLEADLRGDPWSVFRELVGLKFKEEVADVFSWLAAIIVKLDPSLRRFKKLPDRFVDRGRGNIQRLGCPWCHEQVCSDGCLVTHGISSEITEKISKF